MNAPLNKDERVQIRRAADAPQAEAEAQFDPDDGQALDWPRVASISLCAVGLTAEEESRLHALVEASQRQAPLLQLLPLDQAGAADVVLIHGRGDFSQAWWRMHRKVWSHRAMVWLDRQSPFQAHVSLMRPVTWAMLPLVLHQAVRSAPPRELPLVEQAPSIRLPAVMVLSSDDLNRAKMRWMFDMLGRRVTLAETAREGLAALHAAPYDCVILADSVPDLDAAAICRRLRLLENRLGRLPFIRLDHKPSGLEWLVARFSGCDEWAAWPENSKDLGVLLARHTATAKRPDQPQGRSSKASGLVAAPDSD